ncbi:MAG: sugar phosphate isomerase/epimerase [Thermoproteota archaeon]|nr:sugar phosphate isomerase/epimerase [Candidatus Brockarchaeota archaeon]
MDRIKIAVQMYSIRDDCAKDFRKALEAVANIGYEGVEFAGFYGWKAEDLKELLDDLGLEVAGAHIGIDTLMGEELKKTIEYHKALGNKNLIVPGLPENMRNSKEAWLKTAKLFNEISKKVSSEGLRVGYHNHTVEFQKFNGETAFDLFFRNTNPEVIMQLDIGHVMRAGLSANEVLEIIKRYPGRLKTIHLKEYSTMDQNALIGEGEIKWKELLKLCETIGKTEWYVIEQEAYKYSPIECIRIDLKNLKRLLEEV